MTDQEFWKQLKNCFATIETQKQIPSLINRAEKDHLDLPVVVDKENKKEKYHAIYLGNLKFMHCATTMPTGPGIYTDPLQPDQKISTVPLTGLFRKLKADGYDGIVFIHKGGLSGFEWNDFNGKEVRQMIL